MVSVWDGYSRAKKALKALGVAEAELEARELTARAAGLDARDPSRWRDIPMNGERTLDAFLRRREADEPLAYILGEWDFYGNRFAVTPDVLIPRGDTEWLCDAAVQAAKRLNAPRVLDLCCGSGCIGISVALCVPQAQVTMLDCSDRALTVAKRNAEAYGLAKPRIQILRGDALHLDGAHGIFDIVVTNPPYISAEEMAELDRGVAAYEPRLALYGGTDGLDFYRAMANNPSFPLRAGGLLLAECGWRQDEPAAALFREAGWKHVCVRRDLAGVPRIVCAENGGIYG